MKKEEIYEWIFWSVILVFILFVFLISFGQYDLSDKVDRNQVIKDVDKLKHRYDKLKKISKKKTKLNKKLNKRFKIIYFSVRFILVGLYIGYNALLYFVFHITEMGSLLNWNELALIVLALISFISFGTFANVKSFVLSIKMKLEMNIYGKYMDIEKELLLYDREMIEVAKKIIRKEEQMLLNKENNFE